MSLNNFQFQKQRVNGKKNFDANTPTAPQPGTKSKSPPGYVLSCLTDRGDRHKNLAVSASQNNTERTNGTKQNNFLYPTKQHVRL